MAPFYVITLVPVVALCVAIYRFWTCARRLPSDYYRELLRRAPQMQALDAVAVGMAGFAAYYAAMGLWGFTLPLLDEEPLPSWMNVILSAVSSLACIGVVWINAPSRFTRPTWGGMRESVVRTLVALRIIEAAEIAHAFEIIHTHEAHK
ncbi:MULTISPECIES: hypothetical protein [Pseudomonadota]|uniref:hypothetical protein n=1 Tax=Pseudomonadota TaxID=1224 RepID=UPI0006C695CF|nr:MULTISPECIES: hypothetical protein [Pseudomonadota]QKI75196.1 hypothetical protein HPS43_07300 [Achromobacter xylosoxidans]CUI33313.1 Uncharacterised protein [Achromobacter xylosoxidans]